MAGTLKRAKGESVVRQQAERTIGGLLAALAASGIAAAVLAYRLPQGAPVIILGLTLAAAVQVWAAFTRIRREVDGTLSQVDDTIRSLLEGRQEQYFSPNEDTLLGKFQTEIAALYELLTAGKAREEAAREELERTISHLVHQLNTPITNIRLYSNFLLEEDLTAQERQRFAQHIQAQAEKVSFLGEGFAKLSRLETGIMRFKVEHQPILPMVLAAIDGASAKASAHGNTIVLTGDQQLAARFDPKWTQEALFNVLDNAVKYSDSHTTIAVEMTAYELFVRISVTDSGQALAAEEYAQVFQRFYRSEAVREQEGVGLGLYLAREILRSQGGYIKAESLHDGRVRFSLYLLK